MTRRCRFAGSWYPDDGAELAAVIDRALAEHPRVPGVRAVMAPHAGLIHSGAIAGRAFAAAGPRRGALILAPNHRDRRPGRPAFALAPEAAWETPLGTLTLDAEGARVLVERARAAGLDAALDAEAHDDEHAIELELPFLQRLAPEVELVAVSVATTDPDALARFGALAGAWAWERWAEDGLLVASSDMTHYEPAAAAAAKDAIALERLLAFDGQGLLERCAAKRITMCGRAPAAALIAAAHVQGASRGMLLERGASRSLDGEPGGPVVGYAAVALTA